MHRDRSRLEGCRRLEILRPEQNKETLRPVGRMSTELHKNDKNHKNAMEFTRGRGLRLSTNHAARPHQTVDRTRLSTRPRRSQKKHIVGPELRKNSIWLPSDRDVGTCFFGFPSLET